VLLVLDANILFSAVIKNGKTAELLTSDKLDLITPEFILSEFSKYKQELLIKTHRSPEEFAKFLLIIQDKVDIIPSLESKPFLKQAESLSPDPKDLQYFAVALKYNCAIWSNDKILKEQKGIKVFSTSELANELKS